MPQRPHAAAASPGGIARAARGARIGQPATARALSTGGQDLKRRTCAGETLLLEAET